jgi:hypothetical protein
MVRLRGVEARMSDTPPRPADTPPRPADTLLRPEDAPASIYGADGKPQFFGDPAMDRFVSVLLNVTSELWVQTERVDTLTALLERQGLATPEQTARIVADDDAKREAALRDFVARVLAPLREPAA